MAHWKFFLLTLFGVTRWSYGNGVPTRSARTQEEQKTCNSVLSYEVPGPGGGGGGGGSGSVVPDLASYNVRIRVNASEYHTGSHIRVTAENGGTLKGIIFQALPQNGATSAVGTWQSEGTGSVYGCAADKDTFAQWLPTPLETSVSAVWAPPGEKVSSDIRFVASVFPDSQSSKFFNVTSEVLPRSYSRLDMSQCGKKKGCYRYSRNTEACIHDPSHCEYIFTYQLDKTRITSVFIELSATAGWVAVGFSSDDKMGGDDVLLCKQGRDGATAEHYYNEGNFPMKQKNNPLEDPQVHFEDGRITCKFTRLLTVPHDDKSVDLTNVWYQFFAWGNTSSSGSPRRHSLDSPPRSPNKRTLLNIRDEVDSAPPSCHMTILNLSFVAVLYVVIM